MSLWFTSDTHYGHARMLDFERRHFSDIEEHDEYLIEQHNALVGPKDRIYQLGDFGWHAPAEILPRLNGIWYHIRGNHFARSTKRALEKRAIWVKDYFKLRVGHERLILAHYPIAEWDGCHKGYWHLHGHCHGNRPNPPPLRRLDVSADAHNLRPLHFDEVAAYMRDPSRKPTPHHGKIHRTAR